MSDIDLPPNSEDGAYELDGNFLATLAILSVGAEKQIHYLDHFVPFVVEALALTGEDSSKAPKVVEVLLSHFGLSLPVSVAQDILKRAVRQTKIQKNGDEFSSLATSEEDRAKFLSVRNEILRKQNFLAEKLRDYAIQAFKLNWSSEEAEVALQTFVGQMSAPQMRDILLGAIPPARREGAGSNQKISFVVSEFITTVLSKEPEAFSCLEQMVKGSMLASALYLVSLPRNDRKFRGTTIWLDTPIALKWLGLEGEEAKSYADSVIDLARKQGAQLGVFEHSLIEMRAVIRGAALSSRIHTGESSPKGVEVNFRNKGVTIAGAQVIASELESGFIDRKVLIASAPDIDSRYSINETELENSIKHEITYASENTFRLDLKSLVAISTLRKGTSSDCIENCQAILITDNSKLSRGARKYFDKVRPGLWPVVLVDHQIASLLWSKSPMGAPDLPRKRIIADALAALQPTSELWGKYRRELDAYVAGDPSRADAVAILRYSGEASKFLMKETLGEPQQVSQNVLESILKNIVESENAPMKEQLAKVERLRQGSELEIEDLLQRILSIEADETNRKNRIIERSTRLANKVRKIFKVSIFILYLSFVWTTVEEIFHVTDIFTTKEKLIVSILSFLFILIHATFSLRKGGITKLEDDVQSGVQRWMQKKWFE